MSVKTDRLSWGWAIRRAAAASRSFLTPRKPFTVRLVGEPPDFAVKLRPIRLAQELRHIVFFIECSAQNFWREFWRKTTDTPRSAHKNISSPVSGVYPVCTGPSFSILPPRGGAADAKIARA